MKAYTYILIAVLFLFLSCEIEDFKKELPMGHFDSTPRLVAAAAIEDGRFYLYLNRSYPISPQKVELTGIKEGEVFLYEDDVLIYNEHQTNEWDNYNSLYFYCKNITVTPKKTYRLKVISEGYEPVESTVVAPDYPQIGKANLNTNEKIKQSKIWNSGYAPYAEYYYPLTVEMTDKPNERNYYSLEVVVHDQQGESESYNYQLALVTTDKVLIQDNPSIEADNALTDPDYNTYAFSKMLISDLSFKNKTIDLNLLLGDDSWFQFGTSIKPPERPGYHIDSIVIQLNVKSISPEIFEYHRAYKLQDTDDVDFIHFFGEPAIIRSNIENGYGYFAVNTQINKDIKKLYRQRWW